MADGRPVRSGDGVVLLRLTCNSHGPAVLEALETAEELEDCSRMVLESGCEVTPEGKLGPKFFVPAVVEALREDLVREGVELQGHHILIRESDVPKLREVLSKVPFKYRPGLKHPNVLAVESDDQEPFVLEHAFAATDSDRYYPRHDSTDRGLPSAP